MKKIFSHIDYVGRVSLHYSYFHICEFAYLLNLVCYPKARNQSTFVVTLDMPRSPKNLSCPTHIFLAKAK